MTWKTAINSLITVALLTVTTSVIILSVYSISALREHRRAAGAVDSTMGEIRDSVQSFVQKGNGVIDTLTLPAPNGGRSPVVEIRDSAQSLLQKANRVIDTLTIPASEGRRSTVENFQEVVNVSKKLVIRVEKSNGMLANYLLGDRVPDSPGRSPCPEEPPAQALPQTADGAESGCSVQ